MAAIETIEQAINGALSTHNVRVFFSTKSAKDFRDYDKGNQKKIIAAIIQKCIGNPLIQPHGTGLPCRAPLTGFAKIRLLSEGIRIIYRPTQNADHIRVEVIVIGPRNEEEAYAMASARLEAFKQEMAARK